MLICGFTALEVPLVKSILTNDVGFKRNFLGPFPFLLCVPFGCIEKAVLQIPGKEIRSSEVSSTAEGSSYSLPFLFYL